MSQKKQILNQRVYSINPLGLTQIKDIFLYKTKP